jgi:glycosyltransferase involved in cell wall biosynthesis
MQKIRRRFHFVSSNRFSVTGGAEILWTRTAGLLLQEGHDVSISVPDIPGAGEAFENLRGQGAEVYRYPLQRPSLRTLPLERKQFDLVIINQGGSYDGIEWAETCVRRNLSFVTIAQAVRPRSWPGDNLATRILAAFSKAKQNFFVSHGNLKLFEYQLAAKLTPATIIHNPAAMENRSILPWPSEDEGYRLACVGRLSPTDKRQDLILQVMGQEKWKGRPLTITFFGTGNHLQALTRMRASLGLEKQIVFAELSWKTIPLKLWMKPWNEHGRKDPTGRYGASNLTRASFNTRRSIRLGNFLIG